MKRAAIAMAFAALLVGCASKEQIKSANDVYLVCMRDTIREIDDGASDPASVAEGAFGMCQNEHAKVVELRGQGILSRRERDRFESQVETDDRRRAVGMVLMSRRAKRAKSSSIEPPAPEVPN